MKDSKKYYYRGYECIASFQPESGHWLCVVDNVTEPFEFDSNAEEFIQGNLEYQIKEYIARCEAAGIYPRKDKMRMGASGKSIRELDKERAEKEALKEAQLQQSNWKYLQPAFLMGIPTLTFALLASLGKIFPFTIFFPYRANVITKRTPVLTLLVCFICIIVFIFQVVSERNHNQACYQFIKKETEREEGNFISAAYDFRRLNCGNLEYLRRVKHPEMAIREQAAKIMQENHYRGKLNEDDMVRVITETFEDYKQTVSPSVTERLLFLSNHFDFIGAYTSTFAHANWSHIIFNLIFFYAFAASVELLAGHLFFLLIFAISPLFIASLYSDSLVIAGDIQGNGALGLSGVCDAFMACLLVLKPNMKIKTLFWFLVIVRVYTVPIWFIAGWWVSWDIGVLLHPVNDGVNHVAHFVGAITGAAFALAYRIMDKKMNHDMLEEEKEVVPL